MPIFLHYRFKPLLPLTTNEDNLQILHCELLFCPSSNKMQHFFHSSYIYCKPRFPVCKWQWFGLFPHSKRAYKYLPYLSGYCLFPYKLQGHYMQWVYEFDWSQHGASEYRVAIPKLNTSRAVKPLSRASRTFSRCLYQQAPNIPRHLHR